MTSNTSAPTGDNSTSHSGADRENPVAARDYSPSHSVAKNTVARTDAEIETRDRNDILAELQLKREMEMAEQQTRERIERYRDIAWRSAQNSPPVCLP
jgi:hypothetical protein